MARLPVDVIPQRRLLNLLRLDIDHAMSGQRAAERRIHALVQQNPNSCFSTYVVYNLGLRRSTWMAREATRMGAALPRRYDAQPTRSSQISDDGAETDLVRLVEKIIRGK